MTVKNRPPKQQKPYTTKTGKVVTGTRSGKGTGKNRRTK